MPDSQENPPAPRVTRRRAETRARLLAAAAGVFTERGFGRTTVEDVCERASFSRGAFYSNFGSLDELFFALYSDRSAEVVQAVATAVRGAVESDAGSLPELVSAVISVLPVSRESHLLNLEFAAHAIRHPEVAAALAGHRRSLRQALTPVLRMGLEAVAAPVTDDSLDHLARAVLGVQDGMYLQELLEPQDASLPALRRQTLAGVLVSGPGSPAPQQ